MFYFFNLASMRYFINMKLSLHTHLEFNPPLTDKQETELLCLYCVQEYKSMTLLVLFFDPTVNTQIK